MSKEFDAKKCLVNLKLALNRIRLQFSKKTELNEITKREVAALIKENKTEQARIRTVTVIHMDYYLEVLQVLETQVETIAARMDVISAQLSCPLDLKEPICSVIHAAPFLDNSPELVLVRTMFIKKYGKDFPQDCVNSCCVNKKVQRGLARDMPEEPLINYYLTTISGKHQIDFGLPGEGSPAPAPGAAKTGAAGPATPAPISPSPRDKQNLSASLPAASPKNNQANMLQSAAPSPAKGNSIVQGVLRADMSGNHWLVTSADGLPVPGQTYLYIPVQFLSGAHDGQVVYARVEPSNPGVGRVVKIVGIAGAVPPPASAQNQSLLLDANKPAAVVKKAVFRIDQSGHSWAMESSPGQSKGQNGAMIFIAPTSRNGAEDGDFVAVQLHNRKDGKLSGNVVQILQRRPTNVPLQPQKPAEEVQGMLSVDEEGDGNVVQPRTGKTVFIPQRLLHGGRDGDLVRVAIDEITDPRQPLTGRVVSIDQPRPANYIDPYNIQVKILIDSAGNGHCPNLNTTLSKADPSAQFVFVDKNDLGKAQHGDMVVVRVNPNVRSQTGSLVGKIGRIVETAASAAYNISAQLEALDDSNHIEDAPRRLKVAPEDPDFYRDSGIFASLPPGLSVSTDDDQSDAMIPATPNGDELDELSAMWDSNVTLTDKPAAAAALPSAPTINISPDKILVVDIGSSSIKAGFANQPVPTNAMPTVIGRPQEGLQKTALRASEEEKDVAFGAAALARKGILTLEAPFERGIVADWKDMSQLLRYLFTDVMKVDLSSLAVVFTEPSVSPTANKERFAQIFFDELNVACLHYARASVLAGNAAGYSTGLIVDIGHTLTTIVPVYEGFVVTNSARKLNLAGHDITEQLARLLANSTGMNFNSAGAKESLRSVKEKFAYVAKDASEESKKFANPTARNVLLKQHTFPDGKTIIVADEAWLCAEILFNPKQIGREEGEGIQHLIHKTVMECDVQLRKLLLNNIILAGGSSLLPDLATRLEKELTTLFHGQKVRIHEMTKRQFATWIGGSMLACSRNFKEQVITKETFKKSGPSIINQKVI